MNWLRIFILAGLSVLVICGQTPVATGSFLGIGLTDLDEQRASELGLDPARGGVELTRVQVNSPAAKAGLRPGDILLSYNGEAVLGGRQLTRLVSETPVGRKVNIQFWRDAKARAVIIVTASRPPEEPDFNARYPWPQGLPPEIPEPVLVWKNTMLGLECESLNSQLAGYFAVQHGILVRFVEKSSPADNAGLRAGDVIIAAGQRKILRPQDLASELQNQAGSGNNAVRISLLRDRKHLLIDVGVGE